MEDKKYQREEGKNDAERAYLPRGRLESLLYVGKIAQINYGGKENGK